MTQFVARVKQPESNKGVWQRRALKLLKRSVTALTASSFLLTSLVPAYAQVITDPNAPIEFRPSVGSSANGTPTVDIVRPSDAGVSHNKFREYNIDTRGLILNNSGLGGTSVIGGAVAPNPNLVNDTAARVILNEVTGTKRSSLNGPTEVFGAKADVFIANPNGISCVGCGFINTGTATLSAGVPIIDSASGSINPGHQTSDVTVSGTGVSAPAGALPDNLIIRGNGIHLDGVTSAKNHVNLTAGNSNKDAERRTSPTGSAITSTPNGVVRAHSIQALTTDIDTGIALLGNLQSIGRIAENGTLEAGDIRVISSGDLSLVSGQSANSVVLQAERALSISRGLSAKGEIAITARDIDISDRANVTAGKSLAIMSQAEISSAAVLKSGAALKVAAGANALVSGVVASAEKIDILAKDKLTTEAASLVAPKIHLEARDVVANQIWIEPGQDGSIHGQNIELGDRTVIDPAKPFSVDAARRLTLGTTVDVAKLPLLSLRFRDLDITGSGAFITDQPQLNIGELRNAGKLLSNGQLIITAETLTNNKTGIIKSGELTILTTGELINLGRILSAQTLSIVAGGTVNNEGSIAADKSLTLEAEHYIAGSKSAILAAENVDLLLRGNLSNAGAIQSQTLLALTTAGALTNSGEILANQNLDINAGSLKNDAQNSVISTVGDVKIRSGQLQNVGRLAAQNLTLILSEGLNNAGSIHAQTDASINISGHLSNSADLRTNRNLQLRAGSVANEGRSAVIGSGENAKITAGRVTNSGLIAATQFLSLASSDRVHNAALGEIVGRALDLTVAQQLENLGQILSEDALKVVVSGIATNFGALRSNKSLSLLAAELESQGDEAVIAGRDVSLTSTGNMQFDGSSVSAAETLSLSARNQIANSGTIHSGQSLSIDAASLANDLGGRVLAGGLSGTQSSDATNGVITVKLKESFQNAGEIIAARLIDMEASGAADNSGSLETGGLIKLQSQSFTQGTAQAKLVARNLNLIIGSAVNNAGRIAAAENLELSVDGDLHNNTTGKIDAGYLEGEVAGALYNRGEISTEQTIQLNVAGIVENHSNVHAGADLILTARDVYNFGRDAALKGNRHVLITAAGEIVNVEGKIFSGADMRLNAMALLRNVSGRIESRASMELNTQHVINDALAGSDGGTEAYYKLDQLSVLYQTSRSSRGARYRGELSAAQTEYSGTIQRLLPGTIRAGAEMVVNAQRLDNLDGRILSLGNMALNVGHLLNAAKIHTVDQYQNTWHGDRLDFASSSNWFHAPIVANDPNWVVKSYVGGVFKDPKLEQLAEGGERVIMISKGKSPITRTYGGRARYRENVAIKSHLEMIEFADAAELVNLELLGIDPNNIPDVLFIGLRSAELNAWPYGNHQRRYVGTTNVAIGSLIKASGNLHVPNQAKVDNNGTMSGNLVSIDASDMANGLGNVANIDGSGFGRFDRSNLGDLGTVGSRVLATGSGQSNVANFVIDDVAVPVLDLGAFSTRNLHSVDPNNFNDIVALTGSLEAANILRSVGLVNGQTLKFFADPAAEARAFAQASQRLAGRNLVIDNSLSAEKQREELYRNGVEFAEEHGLKFGVALTEAQRAALDRPMVWLEPQLIDGVSTLVPRLYLPSADELLRGARGSGLISAENLVLNVSGRLSNAGAIVASNIASISASSIINQRLIDFDRSDRTLLAGRNDSGLISAGTLLVTTDKDLINYGGSILSSGDMDLRIGGSLINETQRFSRTVDSQDGCVGNACGTARVDYNVARIASGADLTIIAGQDIKSIGAEIGAVTDLLLAAKRDILLETIKDSFVKEDYKQKGLFSSTSVFTNEITGVEASAQSLLGNLSIFAGYGLCDGGTLCKSGAAPGDVLLKGAMIAAFGDLAISSTGAIDMGVVSQEVHNRVKTSGISGLTYSNVKQNWNEIETSTTRLSGFDVILDAKGPITGTGVKVAAINDILMRSDQSISLKAHQDALYFTEKGFSIGLSFPGSAGIDAALRGGSSKEIMNGLASATPIGSTLVKLANADNGVAAGFAALNAFTAGADLFGTAAKKGGASGARYSAESFRSSITDSLNPINQFTDDQGTFSAKNVSLNFAKWSKDQRWSQSHRSDLNAGGDIVMQAGLDVLLEQGTKLTSGGNVSIKAERDIILSALTDYARDKSKNAGLSISPKSIGINVGRSSGYDETLTNASITAAGRVDLDAGRVLTIAGGNIAGRKVNIDVGRDLSVISPQALGSRSGSSFGLSVGPSLDSFGVSGSKERGNKAWSSGSSITSTEDLDIDVGRDTLLQGALLHSKEGDINLDTKTLTVVDNKDVDQYKNVGGGLGFGQGSLNSVNFNYENKDKQGETRTTMDVGGKLNVNIRDADKDGIEGTDSDRAASEAIMASINRDASTWQVVTKDEHTKISGELDVRNLRNLGDNLKSIDRYVTAQNAQPSAATAAQGPRAVDLWRKMIINGASVEDATRVTSDPDFTANVQILDTIDTAIAVHGEDNIPKEARYLLAKGLAVILDKATGKVKSLPANCDTFGRCMDLVDGFLAEFKKSGKTFGELTRGMAAEIAEHWQAFADNENYPALATMFNRMVLICQDDPEAYKAFGKLYTRIGPEKFSKFAESQSLYSASALEAAAQFGAEGNKSSFDQLLSTSKAKKFENIASIGKTGLVTAVVGGTVIVATPTVLAAVSSCAGALAACMHTAGLMAGEGALAEFSGVQVWMTAAGAAAVKAAPSEFVNAIGKGLSKAGKPVAQSARSLVDNVVERISTRLSLSPGGGSGFYYNAIENPGPLAQLPNNPASNFISGKYNTTFLEDDLVLYRAGEAGTPLGQWFTRDAPSSVAQARIDTALKAQWIDPKTGILTGTSNLDTIYSVKIPKGTTLYEGPVSNQGGVYLGGQSINQVFVPTPWRINGVEIMGSKPLK